MPPKTPKPLKPLDPTLSLNGQYIDSLGHEGLKQDIFLSHRAVATQAMIPVATTAKPAAI